MHQELLSLGEHEAAHYISKLIQNVEKEIKCAELKTLKLNSVAYELIYIYEEQDRIMDKYKCHIDKVHETVKEDV
jgi:hypothetical protein